MGGESDLPFDPVPIHVVDALTRSGLEREHVQQMVDRMAKFDRVMHRPKVFPWGQFGPDGLEIQAVFEPDALDQLPDLLTDPRVDSVEIFPRGIVAPDAFSARIRMR